jgi:hypothetical protein
VSASASDPKRAVCEEMEMSGEKLGYIEVIRVVHGLMDH